LNAYASLCGRQKAGVRKAIGILREGVTEKELEQAFNLGVVEAGAIPFFATICSGKRSAHPNTVPSERKIAKGEVVRFDIGSRYRFYLSDIARTFVMGQPNASQQRCWNAVLAGERAAMETMKPGVTAGEVFEAGVQAARAAGLPNFKRNHVGHGIDSIYATCPY
jgi:Xaa-Pro aminopeptidase